MKEAKKFIILYWGIKYRWFTVNVIANINYNYQTVKKKKRISFPLHNLINFIVYCLQNIIQWQ